MYAVKGVGLVCVKSERFQQGVFKIPSYVPEKRKNLGFNSVQGLLSLVGYRYNRACDALSHF